MKNIIYILIFIPSLLFSQETKNMELVGVRNIELELPYVNTQWTLDSYQLNVDSNSVLKIISISTGVNAYWGPVHNSDFSNYDRLILHLNGTYLFDNVSGINNTSIVLPSGNHELEARYQMSSSSFTYKINLYCQEFKLTTP